jgi:hypothetical protein
MRVLCFLFIYRRGVSVKLREQTGSEADYKYKMRVNHSDSQDAHN